MNRLRSYGAVVVAAVLLVIGHALIVPMSASASPGAPPTVPETIAVPPGSVLLFTHRAKGVQIYECRNGAWALRAPRARLFDPEAHGTVGSHYGGIDHDLTAGPWWESADDGSHIRGGEARSAPSPNANSIPWLRLKVLEWRGAGMFSPVSYIQRLNTEGGVGPTGACQPGTRHPVPYRADYYFYTTPEQG